MTTKRSGRKTEVLQSTYEIGKILTSTLEFDKVIKLIMDKVVELIDAKHWSLLLLDEESDELVFEIAVGVNSDKIKNQHLKLNECLAGLAVTRREPLLIPDVRKDARFNAKIDAMTGIKTQSVICVPLICRGRTLGVIELINKKIGEEFTSNDLEILKHLADYIAIALDNARNFMKIQELTIRDDLTCLYNTRFFHEMLDREIRRAQRKKRELSLIFMDLDHFKNVNDTHGHIYGSRILKEVAEIILASVRNIDIPIRYGGDEFVVVLPETNKDQTERIAKRILESIRGGTFLVKDGLNLKLTMSIGYATFPDDAKDKEELIIKADNAMYDVKNTTRNDVKAA